MRVLLTGATGFIGRTLLPLLAADHEVTVIARGVPPASAEHLASWIRLDLAEGVDRSRLPERVDAVIHLAQSEHYREFPERADDIFAVNVASTFGLLEYARLAGAGQFVFASTGGVYAGGDDPLSETAPISPISFYLRSKYAGEILVGSYQGSFLTTVLRFFFVYGPGQDRMLVSSLAERVRRGEEIVVQGDPGVRINPIHIDDAVRVFEPVLALTEPGVFNVAGSEETTISGLVELLGEIHGRPAHLRHDLASHPQDLVADIARMRDELGVSPTVTLRDGLRGVLEAQAAT